LLVAIIKSRISSKFRNFFLPSNLQDKKNNKCFYHVIIFDKIVMKREDLEEDLKFTIYQ
jgi:hypothetical protein